MTRILTARDAHFAWLLGEQEESSGLTRPPDGIESPDVLDWIRRTTAALARAGCPGSWLILEGDDAVADCRKVRVTVASATGGSVRWVWCGTPWTPIHRLDTISLRESWTVQRGPASARLVNRGGAGEIGWSIQGESWLESTDWAALLALLEVLKADGDAPFVFVPNAEVTGEARLVRIGADEITVEDVDQYQTDRRLLTVTVPLAPVALA